MALVMGAFPAALQGAAGGLTFLSRTLGLVSGVAVLAAVFAARRPVVGFDGAFGDAFLVATGIWWRCRGGPRGGDAERRAVSRAILRER